MGKQKVFHYSEITGRIAPLSATEAWAVWKVGNDILVTPTGSIEDKKLSLNRNQVVTIVCHATTKNAYYIESVDIDIEGFKKRIKQIAESPIGRRITKLEEKNKNKNK